MLKGRQAKMWDCPSGCVSHWSWWGGLQPWGRRCGWSWDVHVSPDCSAPGRWPPASETDPPACEPRGAAGSGGSVCRDRREGSVTLEEKPDSLWHVIVGKDDVGSSLILQIWSQGRDHSDMTHCASASFCFKAWMVPSSCFTSSISPYWTWT